MVDPLDRFRPRGRVVARSVLDRLLDDAPDLETDPPVPLSEQVREMREVIRRDIEALLNTRRRPEATAANLSELKDALVSYGVDGFIAASLATDVAQQRLANSIERRISLFETRLRDVRVTILKNRASGERSLKMRIQGYFRLHEGMPPVSFESRIDPSTQSFLVEAADG